MNSPAASGGSAAGRRRWQLPADVSGFVGRSDELAGLSGLLDRFAAGHGHRARAGSARPVWRCARRRTPPRQASAVSSNCPASPTRCCSPTRSRFASACRARTRACGIESLLRDLRGRKLLLILDTCEHLASACAALAAAVLRETNDVRILATSRQPLHVTGEEVLRLGPLHVPAADAVPAGTTGSADGHRTAAGDAVDLFAQRAAAAVSGFTPVRGRPAARHPALPATRRHSARHRARRGPGAGAARPRARRAPGDRASPRRRHPARHRQQAPDAARGHRLVLRAVHPRRAGGLAAAFRLRGHVRPGRRAGT